MTTTAARALAEFAVGLRYEIISERRGPREGIETLEDRDSVISTLD